MARIRSIKPEFWTSEQVMELSLMARLAFIGLWNFCDDGGVHPASPKTLKAEVFPSDDVTSAHVASAVQEMIDQGLVIEYQAHDDGRTYWAVTGWYHQKVDQPTRKYPGPNGEQPATTRRPSRANSPNTQRTFADDSPNTQRTFADDSPNTQRTFAERSPLEGKGEEGSKPKTGGIESEYTTSTGITRATPPPASKPAARSRKTPLPDDFGLSDRVRRWAEAKGFVQLDEHLEAFVSKARAKGYTYADWDEALMGAIRDDWAGLRLGAVARAPPPRLNGSLPGTERLSAAGRATAEAAQRWLEASTTKTTNA